MSDPGVPSELLRFRRFRDPEGSFLDVPRAEVTARYSARELDLEDELLHTANQTWIPLWKAQRGTLPEGWSLLVSQRQPELRELKAMVRRGELTFSAYVQRRDQLR